MDRNSECTDILRCGRSVFDRLLLRSGRVLRALLISFIFFKVSVFQKDHAEKKVYQLPDDIDIDELPGSKSLSSRALPVRATASG